METDIRKEHWEETVVANQNLIIQNKLQIIIAGEVIKKAKLILKEQFPEEQLCEDAPANS